VKSPYGIKDYASGEKRRRNGRVDRYLPETQIQFRSRSGIIIDKEEGKTQTFSRAFPDQVKALQMPCSVAVFRPILRDGKPVEVRRRNRHHVRNARQPTTTPQN